MTKGYRIGETDFAILQKLQGLCLARAIHVAVRLGLPDLLGNGPKRLSELASTTDSNEPALHRLLRCLKHLGIITEIISVCEQNGEACVVVAGSMTILGSHFGESRRTDLGCR